MSGKIKSYVYECGKEISGNKALLVFDDWKNNRIKLVFENGYRQIIQPENPDCCSAISLPGRVYAPHLSLYRYPVISVSGIKTETKCSMSYTTSAGTVRFTASSLKFNDYIDNGEYVGSLSDFCLYLKKNIYRINTHMSDTEAQWEVANAVYDLEPKWIPAAMAYARVVFKPWRESRR